MTSGPPGVALLGCGRWGRNILRDLVTLGARVVVVDPDEGARAAALAAGAVEALPDTRALAAVEGAVVATPTTTHAEVVADLLRRAIPVFVEKPMTSDPEAARRLAAEGGTRLFVMHKWRYHPGIERLGAMARSGELGAVRSITTCRRGVDGPHADVDPVWILAPHDLSIVLEILGHVPTPRLARGQRVGGRTVGLTGVLGEDPWAAIEVSALGPRRREVRVTFDDGVALLPGAEASEVLVYRAFDPRREGPREPLRHTVAAELPLLRELRTFLHHLRGGPPPRSTAMEEVRIIETIAALREMARLPTP